jgi:hypothetical protein
MAGAGASGGGGGAWGSTVSKPKQQSGSGFTPQPAPLKIQPVSQAAINTASGPYQNDESPAYYGDPAAPSPYYGGSSVYSQPAPQPVSNWTAADQAAYDQANDQANFNLNRIPGQLGVADENIQHQYDQQYNGLKGGLADAETKYGQSVTKNQQDRLTSGNQISSQANRSLSSIMRLLGGLGAGSGSEAKFLAPGIVGKQASAQTGKAGIVYATNARNLDQNIGDFRNKEAAQEAQLWDWQAQQHAQAHSQSDGNKQNLLQQLASLVAQRNKAMGGNGVAVQQPYIDQINGLSQEIDNLGRINPTWNGIIPTYTAPTLGNFQLDPAAQSRIQAQAEQSGSSIPYLSLLLGQKDKQQQPLA